MDRTLSCSLAQSEVWWLQTREKLGPAPDVLAATGPESSLNVGMVEMVMARMMMVLRGGKCRTGEDHHKQDGDKNLLHAKTLALLPA